MQLVLTDYLDIQNTAADAQQATSSFSEQSSDISSYFSRRKIQRFADKTAMFHFDLCLLLFIFWDYSNYSIIPDQRKRRYLSLNIH